MRSGDVYPAPVIGRRSFLGLAAALLAVPAARSAEVLRKIAAQRTRAGDIAIMNNQERDAQIHQCKRHCMPRAAGAELHDGCAFRAIPTETLLETATPCAAVEIIPRSAAVRRNRHSVDRADLGGFGINRIEKRQDVLLERVRDVGPREPGSLDRINKLRQPPLAQAIDVDQMIVAIDAGGSERFGEQSRRQRTHDVRAD